MKADHQNNRLVVPYLQALELGLTQGYTRSTVTLFLPEQRFLTRGRQISSFVICHLSFVIRHLSFVIRESADFYNPAQPFFMF
jgi:hypothetical protein